MAVQIRYTRPKGKGTEFLGGPVFDTAEEAHKALPTLSRSIAGAEGFQVRIFSPGEEPLPISQEFQGIMDTMRTNQAAFEKSSNEEKRNADIAKAQAYQARTVGAIVDKPLDPGQAAFLEAAKAQGKTGGDVKLGGLSATQKAALGLPADYSDTAGPAAVRDAFGNSPQADKTRELLAQSQALLDKFKTPVSPAVSPITSGIPEMNNEAPVLSNQTSPAITEAYYTSLSSQLTAVQTSLNEERTRQLAVIQQDKTAAQNDLDNIRSKQEGAINEMGQAAEKEKQMKLDNLEIEQTRFDENYKQVQGLAGRLMDLMTQGNAIISQQKGATGLASIRNPRVNQTISDITAEAGVIQAGISVYNGQMSQAQSQLMNATNVITSAYSDELDYYNTLSDFYGTKSGDSKEKLITLTKDERNFLDYKIASLEADTDRVRQNSENLIAAMTDPDTALIYANSGITINDTAEQRATKLATYSYSQELRKTSNEMSKEGYTYFFEGQSIPEGYEIRTTTDTKGVVKTWGKKQEADTSIREYEAGGQLIREVINSQTGETISKTVLGAAEEEDKGTKITPSEQRQRGLPVGVIGKTMEELVQELNSSSIPQWFMDYISSFLSTDPNRMGETISPQEAQSRWDEYRNKVLSYTKEDEKDEEIPEWVKNLQ